MDIKKRIFRAITSPLIWLIKLFAVFLSKFKITDSFGKGIISGGDLGAASAAMKTGNYRKAYSLYRMIIDRGGAPASEIVAYKKLSWFYENGVCVDKDLNVSTEMKNKASNMENLIYGRLDEKA